MALTKKHKAILDDIEIDSLLDMIGDEVSESVNDHIDDAYMQRDYDAILDYMFKRIKEKL